MLPTFLQKSGHVYVNFSAKWESDCHAINTKTGKQDEGAAWRWKQNEAQAITHKL